MAKKINCEDIRRILDEAGLTETVHNLILLPRLLLEGKIKDGMMTEKMICPYCGKTWEDTFPEAKRYWGRQYVQCPHCQQETSDRLIMHPEKDEGMTERKKGSFFCHTPESYKGCLTEVTNILRLKAGKIGDEEGVAIGLYNFSYILCLEDGKPKIKDVELHGEYYAFVTYERKQIYDYEEKKCTKKLYTVFVTGRTYTDIDEETKKKAMNFPCMLTEHHFSVDGWLTNYETTRDVTMQANYVPLGERLAKQTLEKYPFGELPALPMKYDNILSRDLFEDITTGKHHRSLLCLQCGSTFTDEASYYRSNAICPMCEFEDKNVGTPNHFERDACFISQTGHNLLQIRFVNFRYVFDDDWKYTLEPRENARCVMVFHEDKDPEIHFMINEGYGDDHVWSEKKNYASSKFQRCLHEVYFDKDIPLLQYSAIYQVVEKVNPLENRYSFSLRDLISFIRYEKMYPVFELLVKRGCNEIVSQEIYKLEEHGVFTYIDGTKKKVADALKISEHFVKMLLDRSANIHNLQLLQGLYELDPDMRPEDFTWICEQGLEIASITRVFKETPLTVKRMCEYLENVRINQCFAPKAAICDWYDYLKAAKSIEVDLTDNKAKYPSSLKREHDRAIAKQKLILDAQKDKFFQEETERYGSLYSMTGEKYMLVPPRDMKDLFEEGRKLCHCVGSYSDRIIQGTTCIMFIRKVEEPDKPYFTIEIEPHNNYVVQLRGLSNRSVNRTSEKDLIQFLIVWGAKKNVNVGRGL